MEAQRKYSVALISSMPVEAYSGGRYHAWTMLECLSSEGDDVTAYIDNVPIFAEDFAAYEGHDRIKIVRLSDMNSVRNETGKYDYCICIPTTAYGKEYFYSCAIFALRNKARLIIVNFESPNWFEKYGKYNSTPDMHPGMRAIAGYGALILSSAMESMKYAMGYYGKDEKNTAYDVWSPAINSYVADSVTAERENRIFIAIRIFDRHKGSDDLIELLDEYLRGYTIVCMIGTAANTKDYKDKVFLAAKDHGISVEFLSRVSDKEKFTEMKRAKLVLFPSYFEGYGYPPVEGLYCGARVVAYDLPVIREICGEAVNYCEAGNIQSMRKTIERVLKENERGQVVVGTGSFNRQAERLHKLLDRYYYDLIYDMTEDERIRRLDDASQRYMENMKGHSMSGTDSLIRNAISAGYKVSSILDESQESLENIQSKGKKIYFYGCGKIYRDLYGKYSVAFPIHEIMDEYKKGMKDELSGKEIVGIEALNGENYKDVIVLVTPLYSVDEIISNIRKIGNFECHSLCMMEMNRK